MDCELNDHIIGVNYDMDYACKTCHCMFVCSIRVFPDDHRYWDGLIEQNLKSRFGKYWRLELWKLKALRQLIKKIRLSKLKKYGEILELDMDTVYIFEDLCKPIEELSRIEPL